MSYAYFQPLSFATNNLVNINNYWLRKNNRKNCHHFFPQLYLGHQDLPDCQVNVILNITIVDDYINKWKISSKAPIDYQAEFMKSNSELDGALRTHLIDANDSFGNWDSSHDFFIEARGQWLIRELRRRLEPELT